MKLDYNLMWRYLNDACFDGEMHHAKIHCFRGSLWGVQGQLLVGCYHPGSGEILLHVGTYKEDHRGGSLEALYHEMVHQYIDEVLMDFEAADHGLLFKQVYRNGLEKLNKRKDVMKSSKKKMSKGRAVGNKVKARGVSLGKKIAGPGARVPKGTY